MQFARDDRPLTVPRHALKDELTQYADSYLWPVTEQFRGVLEAVVRKVQDQSSLPARWTNLESSVMTACKGYQEAMKACVQDLDRAYGEKATIGIRMVTHDALNAATYVCSVGETLALTAEVTAPLRSIKEAFTIRHLVERGSLTKQALHDAILCPFMMEASDSPGTGMNRAYRLGSSAMVGSVFHSVLATSPGAERVGLFTRIPPVLAETPIPRGFLVQEVLRELVANSLRAMTQHAPQDTLGQPSRSRGAHVGVKIAKVIAQRPGREVWKFLVTDTGPGLSESQLALLNAGKLTTKRNGGQGVVLNRMAVEQILGGTFKVRSVLGRGLAVSFTVPVTTAI